MQQKGFKYKTEILVEMRTEEEVETKYQRPLTGPRRSKSLLGECGKKEISERKGGSRKRFITGFLTEHSTFNEHPKKIGVNEHGMCNFNEQAEGIRSYLLTECGEFSCAREIPCGLRKGRK